MSWEQTLRRIAERQDGVVAKFQLHDLDLTWDHWSRAKRNGRWEVLSRRVVRLRGSPESERQRAMAAVLDASPGAMLHGPSALAWWGLRNFNLGTIHVSRPRDLSGATTSLATVHQLRDVRPHDLAVVHGVPTETALRAIWTEAAPYASNRSNAKVELGVKRTGRLLDEAHRLGIVTWAALHELVDDVRERGRSGAVIMSILADGRPPGSSPTESRNEDRLEKVIADAGISPLRRQVASGGHEPIGRVDFRDHDLAMVVEVNSLTFHTTPTDREADEVRYAAFNRAGFTVAVIWEDDLWSNPRAVVETIERARHLTRAGDRVTLHSPANPWSQ